jgi:hypothetical protein
MSESKFKPPAYIFVERPPENVWCRSCRVRHKMTYRYDYRDALSQGGVMGMRRLAAAKVRCPRQPYDWKVMLRSKEEARTRR